MVLATFTVLCKSSGVKKKTLAVSHVDMEILKNAVSDNFAYG